MLLRCMNHRSQRRRRTRQKRRRTRCLTSNHRKRCLNPSNHSIRPHPPRHITRAIRLTIRRCFMVMRSRHQGVNRSSRNRSMNRRRFSSLIIRRPLRRSMGYRRHPRRQRSTSRHNPMTKRFNTTPISSIRVKCQGRRCRRVTTRRTNFTLQNYPPCRRVTRRRGTSCRLSSRMIT